MTSARDEALELYGVDFNHVRLVELVKLAEQAEPFYLWVEKVFRRASGRADSLEVIVSVESKAVLERCVKQCFAAADLSEVPKLFNGVGVPYNHPQACFFFFAWLVRDAATQRLTPLVSEAYKQYKKDFPERVRADLQSEVLAQLLCAYRERLVHFSWPVMKEVLISRLEGSRRAAKGSAHELFVRSALAESVSYFFKTHGDYGSFEDVVIHDKPLKVKNRTYDVVATLVREDATERLLVLPVKTRETQGGGHAHLFTRDIEQANLDIRESYPDAIIAPVVIALNWSDGEKDLGVVGYDELFHFRVDPNLFAGFTDQEQIRLNRLVEAALS